jgi:uncharacterized membrane protein
LNFRKYIAVVLDGMAKGLFASLIIGVIIKQIGVYTHFAPLENLGQTAQYFMGPCIGMGIAYARGGRQFTIVAAAIAGALGAGTVTLVADAAIAGKILGSIAVGEPVGAFVAAAAAVEAGKFIEGRTKFDQLIVPAAVIVIGGIAGAFVSPPIAQFMKLTGQLINELTLIQPVPMGILLGIVVGVILTLPISSAALCISIGISGIAAGAALAGCCAQMVGFAVISFRENKVGGLVSQGIGTSMIQVPNIIKNPLIWIPPTIAGAACGLLAAAVFKMETTAVGAGMGTAGFVGQFTTVAVMGSTPRTLMLIGLVHFLLPAVISLAASEFMRKKNWIRFGDMRL